MRRLLCFFDGTWNTPDHKDEQTNVVKLFRAVPWKGADGIAQIPHYEIGIATEASFGRLTFAAGAIGQGVADRIQAGYKFLVETYEPGDEIYIFGFSRGAFQARSLGGLIALGGILKADAIDRIPELWACYQEHKDISQDARIATLRAAAHTAVRIKLVGVWDTVGNLGIPLLPKRIDARELAFYDTQLAPGIDVGLHALAIDEPRGPFSPTLWTKPAGASLPPGQLIEQVWFPGCHANVGGGYRDCALSDISLLWMAERAMATTRVTFDLEALRQSARPDPLGEAVLPTSDGAFRVSGVFPFVRLVRQNVEGLSPLRRAVFRTWRSSKLAAGEEAVNELIHASAIERYDKPVRLRRGTDVKTVVYRPRTLSLLLAGQRNG